VHIGWLALESLCNQVEVNFNWELIVCEELHDGMLGVEFFEHYVERLKQVGCVRVTYIELPDWISLASKWQLIGQQADLNSEAFILQAADCYTPSKRLAMTHKWINARRYDWLDFTQGYFYSFKFNRLIQYQANSKTNLHMAFKTAYARNIPGTDKLKGIDGFLYDHCKSITGSIKVKQIEELQEDSIDTDGHNNISVKRINFYKFVRFPFVRTSTTLEQTSLPSYIVKRIKEMT
jgi:hypothetical protein